MLKQSKYFLLLFLLLQFINICSSEEILSDAIIKISSFHQSYIKKMPWLTTQTQSSSGSGFIIEGNRIITNAHVVTYAKYLEITKQNSAKRYIAKIKYISHSLDLAMLEVNDSSLFDNITPLKIGSIPALNSKVQTIGFPIGGEKISVTNGVVSRIENITYSHAGAEQHLAIQTDSAINPGNSGGPVIQNNKVVGVAFQGIRSGDNIGYMIPTTMIQHFLKDSEDGQIDGTPELGVYFNTLPQGMRNYLNLPKDKTGVVIISTHPSSPATTFLKKNDILLEINGYKIDDDSNINIDKLRLPFYEIIERSQYGETIEIKWFRKNKIFNQTFKLSKLNYPFNITSSYPNPPDYFFFAGLTFVELNGDYVRSFGKDWWKNILHQHRLLYFYQTLLNEEQNRKSYIILSTILDDTLINHALKYEDQILESINDKQILSFQDLRDAITSNSSEFYKFNFLNNPMPLIINSKTAKQLDQKIFKNNKIPKKNNIDWKKYHEK